MCVRQLVHLFIEKWKSGIFCSVFKISLPKLVDIFSLTYLTDWWKFNSIFFVCVSVSWFICSLKNGKIGYFAKFSRYIYQIWWTSSTEAISQIGLNKISKVCLWVCQLVHLLTLWIILNISVPCWWNSLKLSTPVLVIILVLMNILWWWWW